MNKLSNRVGLGLALTLTKGEMRNISGGQKDICGVNECAITITGNGGCLEGFMCVAVECDGGVHTYNKCVPGIIE